jgi:hypothetical protein
MDPVTKAQVKEFSVSNNFEDLSESKQFEHFCAYSVFATRFPEQIETDDMVAGDGGDLNIDAFAVKVNGRLVEDADVVDDILALSGSLDVEFLIIQAKTSSNFDGAQVMALGDNLVHEIFAETQQAPINDDIKRFIEIKDRIYNNAAKLKENPVLRIFYICTGNWKNDEYITNIINRKKEELTDTNQFSEVSFEPLGARELQALFRQTKTSVSRTIKIDSLVTLPAIAGVDASYLGILPASEYMKLLVDDDGELMRSVFVDNVRDYQGDNPVNTDIAKTIQDGCLDQFVIRNNGITIVAKGLRPTAKEYKLDDYQIVNGCQTSHVLFDNRSAITDDLIVPIKLIHTEDDNVAQAIIKSTNKQTQVDDSDLLAYTPFQHGLEDFFASIEGDMKLFYERRGKQYARSDGIEKGRIVTKSVQLKAYSSMFCDLPNQAGRYQGTLLKSVASRVFQDEHRPEAYYLAALTGYRFEIAIRRLPVEERIVRAFKYYLLTAFRYRYEASAFPGAGSRKVETYCNALMKHLANADAVKPVFEECVDILKQGLENLDLELERDSAKSAPLVAEVKRISEERR